ncbi:cytochrome P450 [Xylariales sp. AK1849]|nr:cytochrome P450 [Xylariales sp. AK1849]
MNTYLGDIALAESKTKVLYLSGLVLVLHILITAIYRLYFHPLAKHPGPFWARLTGIPSFWHTLRQDRHVWLWCLQQQYGPLYRYAPNGVVINTPTAFRAIAGPKGNVRKRNTYKLFQPWSHTSSTLQSIDIMEHGRKRKVLNHVFSEKSLRSFEPFVQANLERWCQLISQHIPAREGWSASFNMASWATYLTFDIMGDLCMGKSFGLKEAENTKMSHVIDLLEGIMILFQPISHSPLVPIWLWLKPHGLDWLFDKYGPRVWRDFVGQCLDDRIRLEEAIMKNGTEPEDVRKDFFHYLFNYKNPDTGENILSRNELWMECELLIVAGADTTATVIAALFFYLVHNLDVQAKLAQEIRSEFSHVSQIVAGPKLHACKYLRAVISEALRLAPPVAAEPQRTVAPGGSFADGHFFPPGVELSVCNYCLGLNEEVFPDPFRFRPERWMAEAPGNSEEAVKRAESGLSAFWAGTRGCVGKNLAWMEMSIVLARAVFSFEMRRDPHSNLGGGNLCGRMERRDPDHYQTYDAFVATRDGPLVQFKERAPPGP